MSSDLDQDLQSYFTDVEHLREMFKFLVAAPMLTKRLLVIHGVGGVGKSSLLRMFRLHCKGAHVPVALASGDEAKSALDVLSFKSPSGEERGWVPDLKEDGVRFPKFDATFEHYRAIQAKVNEQAKKAQDARGRIADIAGKAASKTAEAAAGAALGGAIGSIIPGIGTVVGTALGGILGGMGAEALVDWLRGFLTKPDIDLLLDPTKKLTDDFLADAAQAADKRRIVLMLDTFEQMTALDDWARDVAQQLHTNALLLIAGRAMPNWSHAWDGWMANAQVEELKPMTEGDMRELARRYYAMMRGGEPNPVQVEAIIRFARGLPMVVTSAVQLWVKYGVEDFQSVKAEIVANLVDRLMEGVPSALIPALEAAAIVRWFDQPILRAVTGLADVREVYNELRRFPFVRVRVEGLALHDAVREIMDENLRAQDSERHCELHERAAAYFEKRLDKTTGEEAERLRPERLYHRIRADEEAGIKLFQEMAEELVRYRLINRLRALLNDVNTYPLERENSKLWREYYHARIDLLRRHYLEAEVILQKIKGSQQVEPKLQAYVLCDLGGILQKSERLWQKGGIQDAIQALEDSLKIAPEIDSKLIYTYLHMRGVYVQQGKYEQAIEVLQKQLKFFQEKADSVGIAEAFINMRFIYGLMGNWRRYYDAAEYVIEAVSDIDRYPFIKMRLVIDFPWGYLWSGRFSETENILLQAINYLEGNEDFINRDSLKVALGCALGYQGKYTSALSAFEAAMKVHNDLGNIMGMVYGFLGITEVKQGKLENAEAHLLKALSSKQEKMDYLGIPEILNWLGELNEVRAQLNGENQNEFLLSAGTYYLRQLNMRWIGRLNYECAALTGLVRVKHAQGDYAAIPPLLAEAEQLAQQYEYNDRLASLRLTQGHITRGGYIPEWDSGFDAALRYYQLALIHALRYNRFLLDEVLNGQPQGTPLRPIIPYCLECGEEGRRFLLALRVWWKSGVNDIGTPRPDTISPIPEGIPLLEAERIAREREPGDGSPQRNVVEQIETMLGAQ